MSTKYNPRVFHQISIETQNDYHEDNSMLNLFFPKRGGGGG